MRRSLPLFALFIALVAGSPGAQSLGLKNTDPSADFVFWTVDLAPLGAQGPVDPDRLIAGLPAAPGGVRWLAPGERLRLVLDPGLALVGAFLPRGGELGFLTPVAGGFILPSELPARGTLLVDRPSFAAANRGRALEAPLQAWGLAPPAKVLDGAWEDWKGETPQLEWGPSFQGPGGPWPAAWPRPVLLGAQWSEGLLWLRFGADRPWASLPPGTSASLALRRPGASLEWPLTGPDTTVWSWKEGTATPVGLGLVVGSRLEARVSLGRLAPAEAEAWTRAAATWVLLVSRNGAVVSQELGTVSGEDLR